jgi:hypothetical protein
MIGYRNQSTPKNDPRWGGIPDADKVSYNLSEVAKALKKLTREVAQ